MGRLPSFFCFQAGTALCHSVPMLLNYDKNNKHNYFRQYWHHYYLTWLFIDLGNIIHSSQSSSSHLSQPVLWLCRVFVSSPLLSVSVGVFWGVVVIRTSDGAAHRFPISSPPSVYKTPGIQWLVPDYSVPNHGRVFRPSKPIGSSVSSFVACSSY